MARVDKDGNLADDHGNVLIWAPEGTKGKAEIEGMEFREEVSIAELREFVRFHEGRQAQQATVELSSRPVSELKASLARGQK